MHGGIWLCRIMENYVCVSEQHRGMFADCIGSFERKESAISSVSLSGAWGEIVCLSGLSAWRMRAVIRSVRGCTLTPSVCAHVRVLACADSNLANVTFSCSEKKDFEMREAFKNFFLAQTGSRTVKTVTHEWLFHLDTTAMAGAAVKLRSRESPEVSVSFITSGWCRSVPCTWLRLHRFANSLTTETRPTTGRGPPWVHAHQIWRTDPSDTTGERKGVT